VKMLIALLLLAPLVALAAGDAPRPDEPAAAVSAAPYRGRASAGSPSRSMTFRIARMVAVAAALYVGLTITVLLLEDRFVYYPVRYPSGQWEGHGLNVEECTFVTKDGVKLHAWWQHGTGTGAAPVLLWFHGNAGNITHRADNLRMLAGRDLDVLIVDYRGYGKSEGRPSEKGLYLDGEAAYRYLTEERGIDEGRIICFGRSLGTSVALHVALRCHVAGVVLESPFADARAMARRMMPTFPVWPFIRSRFDNVGMVSKLNVPLLVIHGDQDEIVPFTQGKAVFEAATEPRQFYTIPGAGHNDTYLVGGEPYFEALLDFCRRCTGGNR